MKETKGQGVHFAGVTSVQTLMAGLCFQCLFNFSSRADGMLSGLTANQAGEFHCFAPIHETCLNIEIHLAFVRKRSL